MMKQMLSTATVILALTAAGSAWGQPAAGPGGPGGPPPGGPGGFGGRGFGMAGLPQLTQEQLAAIRSLNEATAPQMQAVNQARNALNAATYVEKPDQADIKAKVEKLAAAELALALARAEAFAKLQASPNKLNLTPQQILMIMSGPGRGFGGRGGFGGGGFRRGGLEDQEMTGPNARGGGPRGSGGPGGNRPPPN